MNFNLISPSNNGSDYVVQFRENIEIKSNSKVYLNFCELTRSNSITLLKDESIIIKCENQYPKFKQDPVDEEWNLNESSEYYTIPKGDYSIQEFTDLVSDLLSNNDVLQEFFYREFQSK